MTNCLNAPEGWTLSVIVNRPGDPVPPITALPTSPIPETITATLTETFATPQVLSAITDTILIQVGVPTTV